MISARRFVLPLVLASACWSQTAHYEFEVASVRPAAEQPTGQVNVGYRVDGSQFMIRSMNLRDLIGIAYQTRIAQITGPDWLATERYAISATIPEGAAGHEREMLQTLIEERFKLKIHREKRDFPVYALEVGKGPLKLKEVPPDTNDDEPKGTTAVSGGGSAAGVGVNYGHGVSYSFVPNRFEAKKLSMLLFTGNLERFADRPIVDMTGLKGAYDFGFDINAEDYQPMLIRAAVSSGVTLPPQALRLLDGFSSSALADAVGQTGLKLEARKAPLDVIVVDDALKTPIAN